jgi:serine/threonine protein phosphatase PrpC
VLGCDGIWESKTHHEMHKWLKKLKPSLKLLEKMSLLLDDEVSTTEDTEFGKDNMTAIIIEFHQSNNQTP